MSRIYLNFSGFNPDWNTERLTPSVDYVAFKKDNLIISIGCCGWSEYGIEDETEYDARFKDLEVKIKDTKKEEWTDYEEMNEKHFLLLQDAVLYEVGVWNPGPENNRNYPGKKLAVEIDFCESIKKFETEEFEIMEYGE